MWKVDVEGPGGKLGMGDGGRLMVGDPVVGDTGTDGRLSRGERPRGRVDFVSNEMEAGRSLGYGAEWMRAPRTDGCFWARDVCASSWVD